MTIFHTMRRFNYCGETSFNGIVVFPINQAFFCDSKIAHR